MSASLRGDGPQVVSTSSETALPESTVAVYKALMDEVGLVYHGVSGFHETFFNPIAGYEAASEALFKKCTEGDNPLFQNGWADWPQVDVKNDDILGWLDGLSAKLWELAAKESSIVMPDRRLPMLSLHQTPDSASRPKIEVGFTARPNPMWGSLGRLSQMLVPGILRTDPAADSAPQAWLDFARFATEVLITQNHRLSALGFTLCGPLMRLWYLDSHGALASPEFDVNKDGRQCVSTILGLLAIGKRDIGFDPHVRYDGRELDNKKCRTLNERFLVELDKRWRSIAGCGMRCRKVVWLPNQSSSPPPGTTHVTAVSRPWWVLGAAHTFEPAYKRGDLEVEEASCDAGMLRPIAKSRGAAGQKKKRDNGDGDDDDDADADADADPDHEHGRSVKRSRLPMRLSRKAT